MIIWSIVSVTCICLGVEGRRRNLPAKHESNSPDHLESTPQIPCDQRDRCANFSDLPFYARNCFCDRACLQYGDCCRDYAETMDPGRGAGDSGTDFPKGLQSCRRNEDIDTNYEMFMVDVCPKRYPNPAVSRKCENELAPEVFNRIPVTGRASGILYRNVYCAICSGEEDLVFWELAYKCDETELVLSNTTTIGTADEFRRLIGTLRCTLELLPPLGLTPRKCKSNIDKCDRRWKDERVARKCRSYTSYVYLDLETFKNKHCAICNNIRESSVTCEDQRTPYLKFERTWDLTKQLQSTYIVYDINTRQAVVRRGRTPVENKGTEKEGAEIRLGDCLEGSVYDILTDECRCTVGKCLELSSASTRGPRTEPTQGDFVYGRGLTRSPTKAAEKQRLTTVATKTRQVRTTTTTKRNAKATVATTKTTKKSKPSKQSIPPTYLSTTFRTSSTSTRTSGSSIRVSSTSISATAIPATSVYTSNGTSTSTSTTKYTTNLSSVFNPIQATIVKFTDNINVTVSASTDHDSANNTVPSAETTSKPNTVTTVPSFTVKPTTLLETKTIDAKYFRNLDNEKDSENTRYYNMTSITSPTSLIAVTQRSKITPRSSAVVTLATAGGTTPIPRDPDASGMNSGTLARQNCSDIVVMFLYDRFQSLTSLVVTIVSMVSLMVTFVTILVLPISQTMRGKILLSLTLCLFVGQLLYLSALPSHQPFPHQAVCYWVGCALHYFTLGGFFWISVLAFDTSVSIMGDRLDAGNSTNCGRYIAYSLYAWLTPAAILTAGILMDFLEADHLLIRPCYGEGVCFLTGRYALLLILALPAVILTLVSAFLYFLALSYACFEASRDKSKRSNGRTRGWRLLALGLTLTLLVALTWVAGFAAGFYGPEPIWWIFVVLCPAQGIFICLAFICRRTVFNQLRSRTSRSEVSSGPQWSYRKDLTAPTVDRVSPRQRRFGGSDTEIIAHETCM